MLLAKPVGSVGLEVARMIDLLLTSVATLFFEPAIFCLEDIADLYLSVGAFAKQLRKTTVSFSMYVHPFVCTLGTSRLLPDGYS
jgi:hypothetical protein